MKAQINVNNSNSKSENISSSDEGIEYTDSIYRENILDHYKNPRNFGTMHNCDASFHSLNPVCGDELKIEIKVSEKKISNVKFSGKGCAISQSSASMLTEKLIGMSIDDAKKLTKEDIVEMMGISLNPTRLKCAILSLKVFEGAIQDYEKKFKN